jgi:hypothetical protein
VGCGLGSAVAVALSEGVGEGVGEGEGELVAVGLSVGSTTITGGVGSERRRVTSLDHPEYSGAVSWSDRSLKVYSLSHPPVLENSCGLNTIEVVVDVTAQPAFPGIDQKTE